MAHQNKMTRKVVWQLIVVVIATVLGTLIFCVKGLPPTRSWDNVVIDCDAVQMRRHFAWGRRVNKLVFQGRAMPLHYAASRGDSLCVTLLLEQGANPNAHDSDGITPLHWAMLARVPSPEVVRLLLAAGADPNSKHPDTLETPLHYLLGRMWVSDKGDVQARREHEQPITTITNYLIKAGADVDAVINSNVSVDRDAQPLHLALSRGHIAAALLLIESGADVNATWRGDASGVDQRRPLHLSMGFDNKKLVQAILFHGADPNATDGNGQTPLHDAAWDDDIISAGLLLEAGADVRIKDGDGRTPLDCAKQAGCVNVLRLLARKVK